jgi:phosphoribosylformylglycinamidine synthase
MCNNVGFAVHTNADIRKDALLFGEAQSRVVVSVKRDALSTLEQALQSHAQLYEVIGEVTANAILVDAAPWGNIADWKDLYDNAIEALLDNTRSS